MQSNASSSTQREEGVQVHVSFCSFFPSHEVVEGNLSLKPTESFLRRHLVDYGLILDVTVKDYQQYRDSNMQEGYGFVTFSKVEEAHEASRKCQDVEVEGITLKCTMTHRNRQSSRSMSNHGNKRAGSAGMSTTRMMPSRSMDVGMVQGGYSAETEGCSSSGIMNTENPSIRSIPQAQTTITSQSTTSGALAVGLDGDLLGDGGRQSMIGRSNSGGSTQGRGSRGRGGSVDGRGIGSDSMSPSPGYGSGSGSGSVNGGMGGIVGDGGSMYEHQQNGTHNASNHRETLYTMQSHPHPQEPSSFTGPAYNVTQQQQHVVQYSTILPSSVHGPYSGGYVTNGSSASVTTSYPSGHGVYVVGSHMMSSGVAPMYHHQGLQQVPIYFSGASPLSGGISAHVGMLPVVAAQYPVPPPHSHVVASNGSLTYSPVPHTVYYSVGGYPQHAYGTAGSPMPNERNDKHG